MLDEISDAVKHAFHFTGCQYKQCAVQGPDWMLDHCKAHMCRYIFLRCFNKSNRPKQLNSFHVHSILVWRFFQACLEKLKTTFLVYLDVITNSLEQCFTKIWQEQLGRLNFNKVKITEIKQTRRIYRRTLVQEFSQAWLQRIQITFLTRPSIIISSLRYTRIELSTFFQNFITFLTCILPSTKCLTRHWTLASDEWLYIKHYLITILLSTDDEIMHEVFSPAARMFRFSIKWQCTEEEYFSKTTANFVSHFVLAVIHINWPCLYVFYGFARQTQSYSLLFSNSPYL